MKCLRFFLALMAAAVSSVHVSAQGNFNLDFSVNPSLPSAQGLTYAMFPPSAPETQAYQVSGGLLHLNTVQFAGDVHAYYFLAGGYDHNYDAQLTANLRVTSTTLSTFGAELGVYNPSSSSIVVVTPTGWLIYGTTISGNFADPNAFHLLDLRTHAATDSFTFLVDGVVVATGPRQSGFGSSTVFFGDGTITGGNQIADFATVSYVQAVPEPSTVILMIAAGTTLLTAAWRYRHHLQANLERELENGPREVG